MKIAQELYEGIEVGGDGPTGLITYMRTDSLRVSDDAIKEVRERIETKYGPKYLPGKPNRYAAGKQAQEAHEAIRPTDLRLDPESIQAKLTIDQFKLYALIYRRFVASQMTPAVFAVTNVSIAAGDGVFRTQGKILKFDGYRRVLTPAGKQEDALLPPLARGPGARPRRGRRRRSTSPSRRPGSPRPRWSSRWKRRTSAAPRRTPRSSRRSRTGSTSSRRSGGSSPPTWG